MRSKPGPKPRYPWRAWLGVPGTRKTLIRGRDFTCQPHGIAIQARKAAARFRISLSVTIQPDRVLLENRGDL